MPANPGLDLALFGSRHGSANAFPFSAERHSWHLLARGALWHGLKALGLNPGDGILVPAYNHGVEVDTLLQAGLRVSYYAIQRDLTYDVAAIEAAIDATTRAVYVVHYFGFPQSVAALRNLCEERGLLLIEDCALSLFSSTEEGPAGSLGDMSIFCLHKTFGLHHGGILTLNRPGVAPPANVPSPPRSLSLHGILRRGTTSLDLKVPQFASIRRRLKRAVRPSADREPERVSPTGWEDFDPELVRYGASGLVRAAVLRADASKITSRRRHNYERLADVVPPERLVIKELSGGECPLFFPFFAENKHRLVDFLQNEGIEAVPVWLDAHPSIPAGAYPEAEYLRAHVIELPCHQDIGERELDIMTEALKRAFAAGM